jgi:hypothetical protein
MAHIEQTPEVNPEQLARQAELLRIQAEAGFQSVGEYLGKGDTQTAFAEIDKANAFDQQAQALRAQYEQLFGAFPETVILPEPKNEPDTQTANTEEGQLPVVEADEDDTGTTESFALTSRKSTLARTPRPIQPHELSTIVLNAAGAVVVDTTRGLQMVQSREVTELQKRDMIIVSVREASLRFLNGEMTQRALRKAVYDLTELDVHPDKLYLKQGLMALGDDFALIAEELPDSYMIEHGYFDIEVCSAKRAAGYIRKLSYELIKMRNKHIAQQGKYRSQEVSSDQFELIKQQYDTLLEHLFERHEDETDPLKLQHVLARVDARQRFIEIPSYITAALRIMEQSQSYVAAEALEVLVEHKLISRPRPRTHLQDDAPWDALMNPDYEREYLEDMGITHIVDDVERSESDNTSY